MTAFLCLVVAHLEWPLMQVLPLSLTAKSGQRVYVDIHVLPNAIGRRPQRVHEHLVDAAIAGHLRMK
jgi:hypothetical protein